MCVRRRDQLAVLGVGAWNLTQGDAGYCCPLNRGAPAPHLEGSRHSRISIMMYPTVSSLHSVVLMTHRDPAAQDKENQEVSKVDWTHQCSASVHRGVPFHL